MAQESALPAAGATAEGLASSPPIHMLKKDLYPHELFMKFDADLSVSGWRSHATIILLNSPFVTAGWLRTRLCRYSEPCKSALRLQPIARSRMRVCLACICIKMKPQPPPFTLAERLISIVWNEISSPTNGLIWRAPPPLRYTAFASRGDDIYYSMLLLMYPSWESFRLTI